MANRSYLYSSNDLPESREWITKRKLRGISEWNYNIPLTFKLLLSGSPVLCKSSIWETDELIAISGNYSDGVNNLLKYLDRVTAPEARDLILEAKEFLESKDNTQDYFILECGEIFDLTEGQFEEKNRKLLEEIQLLSSSIESIPVPQVEPAPIRQSPTLLRRLFGEKEKPTRKPKDPLMPFYNLGLGNWSNILYFDFSENEA